MDPFVGEIRMFGGNFAPQGWALCNGQLLPIAQNQALFAIIGTFYGGNGTSNFALPNLQGRVPIHQGAGSGLSPYTIGQSGGTEDVTLLVTQMPAHSHTVKAANNAGGSLTPGGNYLGQDQNQQASIYSGTSDTTMNPQMIAAAGGSLPHTNIQPYLCINFIIALTGIFPSRG